MEFERAHASKAEQERRKGAPSRGRGADGVRQKLVGIVLPRHAKVVTALLCVLDAREKDSIVRACRKLRRGDALKFLREIRMQERRRTHPER